MGVKHFCLGWDVGILHDWWQANGRPMRDRLGTEETLAMSDPEIIALREVIAKRPRSDDIAQRRRDIDARGRQNKLAADVTVEPVTANGVKSEWTSTPDADRSKAVLYLHGGGYVIGSLDSHGISRPRWAARRGRARWRSTTGSRRSIRSLPLSTIRSPRYRFLLANGVPSGGITIAGDSAGGGLVVAAMLAIRDAGLPQPACGWTISPWVDMEAIGDSMVSKAATDPTVQKAGILDMAKHYLNGADPRSPLAAPIYGDLRGLAPLLIQVGAAETFCSMMRFDWHRSPVLPMSRSICRSGRR